MRFDKQDNGYCSWPQLLERGQVEVDFEMAMGLVGCTTCGACKMEKWSATISFTKSPSMKCA